MRPQGFICGTAQRGKNGGDKRDTETWKDMWDYEVLTSRAKIDEDRSWSFGVSIFEIQKNPKNVKICTRKSGFFIILSYDS